MKASKRRLQRLEQEQRQESGEEVKYTDGAEYGLEPVAGGWAVLIHNGKSVKAYPRDIWDSW